MSSEEKRSHPIKHKQSIVTLRVDQRESFKGVVGDFQVQQETGLYQNTTLCKYILYNTQFGAQCQFNLCFPLTLLFDCLFLKLSNALGQKHDFNYDVMYNKTGGLVKKYLETGLVIITEIQMSFIVRNGIVFVLLHLVSLVE